MHKRNGILLPIMVTGMALLCHPTGVKASDYYFEEGDEIQIVDAITQSQWDALCEKTTNSGEGSLITFLEEPKEDIHISVGTYRQIILRYEGVEEEPHYGICLEEDAIVDEVDLLSGELTIQMKEPLKQLNLGDLMDLESSMDDYEHFQNVTIVSEVENLKALQSMKDYEEDMDWKYFQGSCVLEEGAIINSVQISGLYCDGFQYEDVFGALEMVTHCTNIRIEKPGILFSRGAWNYNLAELTELTNWEKEYEKRYRLLYFYGLDEKGNYSWSLKAYGDGYTGLKDIPLDFDESQILDQELIQIDGTSSDGLTLEGDMEELHVFGGKVIVNGNVQRLLVEGGIGTRRESCEVVVNGDVQELLLIGDCKQTSISVSGKITDGKKTGTLLSQKSDYNSKYQTDDWNYLSFSTSDGNKLLQNGEWNLGIFLTNAAQENGISYRMISTQMQLQKAANVEVLQDSYSKYMGTGYQIQLAEKFKDFQISELEQTRLQKEFSLGEEYDKVRIFSQAFELGMEYLIAENDFSFSMMDFYEMEKEITQLSEPIEWAIKMDGLDASKKYWILREHENENHEIEYTLLPCEWNGEYLSFASDQYSNFYVVEAEKNEVVKTEDEKIEEEKTEEKKEDNTDELKTEETPAEKIPTEKEVVEDESKVSDTEEEVGEDKNQEDSIENHKTETKTELQEAPQKVSVQITSPQTGEDGKVLVIMWLVMFLFAFFTIQMMRNANN